MSYGDAKDADTLANQRRATAQRTDDLIARAEWLLDATIQERMDAKVHAEDIIAELLDALRVASYPASSTERSAERS
jgi:hypothetical protein